MGLRAARRDRRKTGTLDARPRGAELAVAVVREDCEKRNTARLRRPEVGDQTLAARDAVQGEPLEFGERHLARLASRRGAAAGQERGGDGAHGRTSRYRTASENISRSGPGMQTPRRRTRLMKARIGAPVSTPSRYGSFLAAMEGRPCTTFSTVWPMPMKTTRRKNRNSPPATKWPPVNAPDTIVNSLTNGANGGDPVIERKPKRKTVPESGRRRMGPGPSPVGLRP